VLGITLDTHVYVSALEFGGIGSRLLGMARAGQIRLDVSRAILDELVTALRDDF
jgi:predicted nucleic acid-binding protein